jgi:hypothetical protein
MLTENEMNVQKAKWRFRHEKKIFSLAPKLMLREIMLRLTNTNEWNERNIERKKHVFMKKIYVKNWYAKKNRVLWEGQRALLFLSTAAHVSRKHAMVVVWSKILVNVCSSRSKFQSHNHIMLYIHCTLKIYKKIKCYCSQKPKMTIALHIIPNALL